MKNNYILSLIFLMISLLGYSQTSTETFETEAGGSTSFTDNEVEFNITSNAGTFKVQAGFPGTGWSGTANDNRYIDNGNTPINSASFSIKTTSNLFKVNRFWMFLSNYYLDLTVSGTLTVTGRLSGVTKFSQKKTDGFTTSTTNNNGFTLIDLTNLNGQNYSNIVIDELVLTLGGDFTYASLDAFTWVKDSNYVTGSPSISLISQNNVSCNGGNNGSLEVSASDGTGPYTYAWSPSGGNNATATGLAAGNYTITVKGSDGLRRSETYTITQPNALAATISKTDVSCNGGGNGTASVAVTGGTGAYTYSWAPSGGTAATATGLPVGVYTCTITDEKGCSITRSVTIVQPTALTATTSQTNVSCNGGSNGTASVAVTGGTPSYTYSWAPSGGTAAMATGLVAGTYTCTITDANACQITRSVTIAQPTALTATASKTDVSCNGGANGTASVAVSGGTPSYTYSWLPSGGTAATATGLVAGTYTVTVTDANACQTTRTVTITEPQPINISVTGNETCENNVASLTATGADAYNWYNQATDVNPLYMGSTFVTPVLTNNANYYVKGLKLDTAQSLETTFVAGNNHRGNMIDVTAQKDLLIDSFDVSPQGNTTIEVYYKEGTYVGYVANPSAWTKLGSVPVVYTGNPVNIEPGAITIPAGKTYAFYITSSNTSVSLNYSNGTGNNVFADANMTINAGVGLEYPFTNGTGMLNTPRVWNGRIHYKVITCTSPMLPVVVDVTSTAAPTGDTEQSFNLNDTLAALVVNGQNIKWYATQADAQAHVNALANTTVIVNNTTYYATQTVGQCESSTALAVKAYNATLAVGASNKTKAIQLYPNPVRDILNLKTDEKIICVDVFGIDGKKLMNKARVTTNNQLDVHNLTQGTYILQVTTETKTETIKFIKQ